METWGELNSTEWHGLGLTDPIKKVEVMCPQKRARDCVAFTNHTSSGQMAVVTRVLKSQGSSEATY